MSVTLADLMTALPPELNARHDGDLNVLIHAPVVEDTRLLQPGGVFVARRGLTTDGHRFIRQAIASGAAAVVLEQVDEALNVPTIQVADGQAAVGHLAAAYYGFPSRRMIVVGVTGTDGKTTTSTLIHSVLKHATGGKAGFISTIAADFGDTAEDTGLHVTTPGAPRVQHFLDRMVGNGLSHAVLEMTSHGLAQGRLNGVDIDAAVLTNLTHEHLDYHGTFENYRAAKARMFEMLAGSYRKGTTPKLSIVNADDANADFFAAIPAERVIRYGHHESADVRLVDVQFAPGGTIFTTQLSNKLETFRLALVGHFNVYNALAAVSLAQGFGFDLEVVREGLIAVRAIPGRMERIDEGQDFLALVDFAHTPNALEKALAAARTMTAEGGRVIAVFGSAGLRDVEKRRMMAEVAAEQADYTVLTAEDPRTESLEAILEAMAAGCRASGGIEGQTYVRVPDRGEAIWHACDVARAGDVVIACGKGHEQSMCFGEVEHPWDDREAMRHALGGTPLNTLPTAGKL